MLHYFPLALPFLLILFFLFIFLIVMIEVGVLGYAYQTIGINRRYVFLLLLMCFLGSYINIPVYQLPPETVRTAGEVTFFGIPYIIPTVTQYPGTVIAINIGGAVIPRIDFSARRCSGPLWCRLSFIGWPIRFRGWASLCRFWFRL